MKLVRFGPRGREKPGIVDAKGGIRDLSKVVPDIAGEALSPKGLAKIRKTAIEKLSFEERAQLAAWLQGWEDDEWDEQMKRDIAEGRLDDVLPEVEDDIAAGRVRDMP